MDIEVVYQYEDVMVYAGKPKRDFIKDYILTYDKDFFEPLSARVNIDIFTEKLCTFRGQHIATYLLDAVTVYAKEKNFKFIDLGVYKENVSAYNLYLHYGFKILCDNGVRCEMRFTI